MATQMPIPPSFDRFIEPMTDDEVEAAGPSALTLFDELEDETPEVEELPDGSAIVRMEDDSKGPEGEPDFYENLADVLSSYDLSKLAHKYIELIEKDKEAREDRDKQYEEGLRRTGLGHDAPGGAQFTGASKVVHPVMAEACVDFSARAIKELFPADGPVKTKIIGETTDEKVERAERKRDYMNWQLTEQIEEYRDEEEQLLTQLPLGGSQYMKIWYDDQKRRPCAEFVSIDNVYLPFAAVNFYTAGRVTEVQDITQEVFEERVDSGLYVDIDIVRASMEPEETKAEKANNKIEGRKSQADNVDGVRRVYHIYTWLSLDDDNYSKGKRAPYILMVDDLTTEVVGLYRNWADGDDTMAKLDWLIEFKFIPWRGAYAIGLPHLIGGLSAALTGALRALLDSAHITTAPTMLKLKGAKISGQSLTIEPTQVSEIEGAPGVDDIRKIAMPLPFNQPSPVLLELLGWLSNAAKGVVTTSEEKIADITSNAPVGTTQALIEQGAAVFSAVHARLHDSQRRVLKVIARLNNWYLDEQVKGDMVEDLEVTKEDFAKNSDIVPVSDPHIFAETQRYAQIQTLAARAQANPDLYNRIAVEKRILKQIKLPDINEVLPDPANVKEMNPALENVAMTFGRHAGAFPRQDHLAHIQIHLDYLQDPMYGANPIMAPAFIPLCLEHLKQHLTMWYLNQVDSYSSAALNRPFNVLKEQTLPQGADQLLAAVAQHVHKDTVETFKALPPIIQNAMAAIKQLSGQPPMDPATQAFVQTSMAETQRRATKDQAELQLEAAKLQQTAQISTQKLQADMAKNTENNLTKERIESAVLTRDAANLQHEQVKTALEAQNLIQQTLGAQNG
jgi:enamine deaminase RidA (YjgF/YER057c/UK114 family)